VHLEERRLSCPYTVSRGGESWSTRLIYRYQEQVFRPGEPGDLSLARMIAYQVALNYGLFCSEILFRGPCDPADRRLLRIMARNTAREILVNRIFTPNPFLTPAAPLPPVNRRDSYLNARLLFPEASPALLHDPWSPDPRRFAVLLSGGKESLLSLALLREAGREAHPVFINESGAHWLTALNSYRHLRGEDPATARVWTNADRVFAWMLRRLPFIRQDFSRVRSDDYPLRLWTVAVFSFGALPLLRQRGLGNLVIGDEYDTTRRTRLDGILHYDGLFDQSRYFDLASSRYFQRKGWGATQRSLVRPLSELLVQRVLALRYPRLQEQQTSCHSARMRGGRAVPCGRCEKCRRVVGMLLAVGADPRRCGYTGEQIDRCLRELPRTVLRQEEETARRTLYVLRRRGLLPQAGAGPGSARLPGETRPTGGPYAPGEPGVTEPEGPAPLAEKIRLHPRVSPPEDIPPDIRRDLFRILLPYTAGAVRMQAGYWREADPRELTG
jgi:hypothetical protein